MVFLSGNVVWDDERSMIQAMDGMSKTYAVLKKYKGETAVAPNIFLILRDLQLWGGPEWGLNSFGNLKAPYCMGHGYSCGTGKSQIVHKLSLWLFPHHIRQWLA